MTNYMIFNFSLNYHFNTRLHMHIGTKVDKISETKLLGLKIRGDLKWKSNPKISVKKVYIRMIVLKKSVQFSIPIQDLVQIFTLYIRSIVEQYAIVWHGSIINGEKRGILKELKRWL